MVGERYFVSAEYTNIRDRSDTNAQCIDFVLLWILKACFDYYLFRMSFLS